MGSILCCFRGTNHRGEMEQSPESHSCFRCFTDNYTHMCMTLFRRENDLPDSYCRGTYPIEDDSLYDTFPSLPRPLPYDYLQTPPSQCPTDGMMKGLDKGTQYLHEERESLLLSNAADRGSEEESNISIHETSSTHRPDPSSIDPSKQITNASPHMYARLHEEDECLICFEDYNTENPKIILECTHHYHLSCICEWIKRNQSCPLCGKIMPFDNETIRFPHTVQI